MSDKNIDGMDKQKELADKLNKIAINTLAIESLQEDIEEKLKDLQVLYKECGEKKSIGDIKLIASVYVDEEKARKDEETKIEKSNLTLSKIELAKEELSVLAQYRLEDLYDRADKVIGDLQNKGY